MAPDSQHNPEHDSCDWFDRRIEAHVDGELDRGESERFEAHALRCEACRSALRRAELVKRTLAGLPTLRCPDRVVEAAEAEARADRRHGRATAVRWAVAAAALAACLAVGFFVPAERPAEGDAQAAARHDRLDAADEETLVRLETKLRSRASAAGMVAYERGVARPVSRIVVAVRDSQLGRWGAGAATFFGSQEEASPSDAS